MRPARTVLPCMLVVMLFHSVAVIAENAPDAIRRYVAGVSIELPSDWLPLADADRDEWGAFAKFSCTEAVPRSFMRFSLKARLQLDSAKEENYVASDFGRMAGEFKENEQSQSGPEKMTIGGQAAHHYTFKGSTTIERDGQSMPFSLVSHLYIQQVPNKDGTHWILMFAGMNPPPELETLVANAIQSVRWNDPLFKFARKIPLGETAHPFSVDAEGSVYLLDRTRKQDASDRPNQGVDGDEEIKEDRNMVMVYGPDGSLRKEWRPQGNDTCTCMGFGSSIALDAQANVHIAREDGITRHSPDGACLMQSTNQCMLVFNNPDGVVFGFREGQIVRFSPDLEIEAEWLLPPETFGVVTPNGKAVAVGEEERVSLLNPDGQMLAAWSSLGIGLSNTCEFSERYFDWELWMPAVDRHGNIFAPDTENDVIHMYDPEGHFIAQLGRRFISDELRVYEDGLRFGSIQQVCLDGQGNLYVMNEDDQSILQFQAQPAYLAMAPAAPTTAMPPAEAPPPESVTPAPADARKLEAEFWALAGKARGGKATPDEIQKGLALAAQLLQAKPDDAAIAKGRDVLQKAGAP